MKNKLLLLGWSVLTWFRVPKRMIREIDATNKEVLQKEELWQPGGFIERQSALGALRFGKAYTMAYGGCGLIALYNALVALGSRPSSDSFLGLTADLQRKGVAWGGKYGTHPTAILKWLKKNCYAVKRLGISDADFAQNETEYNVFIVTVLNGPKLTHGMHTVCITKEQGKFALHNGPKPGPHATLLEAVSASSGQGARAIYAMGIRRGDEA